MNEKIKPYLVTKVAYGQFFKAHEDQERHLIASICNTEGDDQVECIKLLAEHWRQSHDTLLELLAFDQKDEAAADDQAEIAPSEAALNKEKLFYQSDLVKTFLGPLAAHLTHCRPGEDEASIIEPWMQHVRGPADYGSEKDPTWQSVTNALFARERSYVDLDWARCINEFLIVTANPDAASIFFPDTVKRMQRLEITAVMKAEVKPVLLSLLTAFWALAHSASVNETSEDSIPAEQQYRYFMQVFCNWLKDVVYHGVYNG